MASHAKTFAQRWIIPDVYPIMAIIGTAACGATYYGIRTLTHNPDVVVDKKDRELHLQGKTNRQELMVEHPSERRIKAGTWASKDVHDQIAALPHQAGEYKGVARH